MKKIILSAILFFLVFLVKPNIIYGQDIADNIPGLTCGVAGDVTGKDKCCNLPTTIDCKGNQTMANLANLATNILVIIPGTGFISDIAKEYLDKCISVQNYTKNSIDSGPCVSGDPSTSDFSNPSCKCIDPNATANVNTAIAEMCYKYLGSSTQANELKSCLSCSSQNGMLTGLGCIPLDLNTFITSFVLTTGIGIGGGFALLCIIYAAFMMQSSQGNPEKLKKAQEMITSCIMGLMLIIFSVFIMKIIGVNILRIPGFG